MRIQMRKSVKDTNVDIGKLIELIGPINNQIRELDGYKKLSLIWDVGDILVKEGVTKIHPVAWAIQKGSYITRDLLSYCYRIRNKWPVKQEMENLFKNIRSYTAFREALPLIENEKFKLKDDEVKEIIKWLAEGDAMEAKNKIVVMKKHLIARSNDRRQRLQEYSKEMQIFKNLYDYIVRIIINEDDEKLEEIKKDLGSDNLLKLSQMCMALTNENYKGPMAIELIALPEPFRDFTTKILPLSLSNKESKARFRRIMDNEKIIEMADILSSIRSGESISAIKKRLGLKI
jgi:acylphosphatase